MRKRIYILDDETDLVRIATDLLEQESYLVISSSSPLEIFKKLQKNPPDLLLLDIRLPEMDGFDFFKKLKADPRTQKIPVIMISAKTDEADVVLGLEMGAEDYICKPFRKRELLARVKTSLRRQVGVPAVEKLEAGGIRVNLADFSVAVGKSPVAVTPKEFELLAFLIRMRDRVVTRNCISENVWGTEYTGTTRTIDVHVDQLRKKLGHHGKAITSLKGIGYRFEPEK